MPRSLPLLLALLGGCTRTVTLTGEVAARRGSEEPLPGGTIAIHGREGEPFATAPIGSDGRFSVEAPGGQRIFAVIGGAGLAPASFPGISGLEREMQVEPGILYGFPTDELAFWQERFEGCPGIDGSGGLVLGQIALWGFVDDDGNVLPMRHGFARTETLDRDVHEACYLDEEGVGYDPEATRTGGTGMFAIFGVPSGLQDLVIGHWITDTQFEPRFSEIFVPEGGVVPIFPAWVELPF